MITTQQITDYYFSRLHELSSDKRFHFASRTAAWIGDGRAFDELRALKDQIMPPHESLADTFAHILGEQSTNTGNAAELRKPYFLKYPQLHGIHLALFRLRHLAVVYGVNGREAFLAQCAADDLRRLITELLADETAVRKLSTFIANVTYLANRYVLEDETPVADFYQAGQNGYDLAAPQDLQLLLYLYTHCIIAAANFYDQAVPAAELPIYRRMLAYMNGVVTEHYDSINLDNKLEFLVCARICNFETALFARIEAECQRSVSPEGAFLIDRLNGNAQRDRSTFAKSEHRNVLYIMSTTPYEPHATRV